VTHREEHAKSGEAILRAGIHRPAMGLHDGAGDGQAQAGAF
jgi:hypothetical protein